MSLQRWSHSRVHWTHLALLAAIPLWLHLVGAWPVDMQLAGWLLLAFAALGLAERVVPHRRDWSPTARHLRRDGSLLALNVAVDALASAALAALAVRAAPGNSTLPLALQVLLGICIAEFGSYWLHRWSHREGWLWRVHLLHHRPERMNLANALTAHPLNALYDKLARLLPLVAFGFAPEAVVAITVFSLTQSLVTHANVAGGIGVLDFVLGSPRLHRLHHSTREDEAGNFGTAIPLWDLAFGTFRRGPSPQAVGVFDPVRYPTEFALGALLRLPFAGPRTASREVADPGRAEAPDG